MHKERQKTDALSDAVEIPEGATHKLNGNYYRREEKNKMRVFHKCGGCCYAYYGNNGCGENNQWSKYTDGYLDERYKPL